MKYKKYLLLFFLFLLLIKFKFFSKKEYYSNNLLNEYKCDISKNNFDINLYNSYNSIIFNMIRDKELMSNIRSSQINLYTILFKTVFLFNKHNINYSLFGGNLLGQLRKKEIIFWDDDIDLVILRDELEKIYSEPFLNDCKLFKISIIYEKNLAYHILDEYNPTNSIIEITQNQYWSNNNPFNKSIGGLSNQLDIFVYDIIDKKTNNCNYYIGPWRRSGRFIKYDNLINTKKVCFGPLKVSIMSNPTEYLNTFIDGDYINKNFEITHNHSNMFSNYINSYPYKLNEKEIEIIKLFSFNISFDELKIKNIIEYI